MGERVSGLSGLSGLSGGGQWGKGGRDGVRRGGMEVKGTRHADPSLSLTSGPQSCFIRTFVEGKSSAGLSPHTISILTTDGSLFPICTLSSTHTGL